VSDALVRLREARLAKKSAEEIAQAQQAVLDARLESAQARRVATQQGSGSPGDRPRADSERGSVVDTYA
jgi:hypothetical protein